MWAWPRGKYHTSPGSKSLVSDCPLGWMTVVRTRPLSTKAHSAAVACQWSSRMAPGSSPMDTPEIPLEIGNCSTVASFAVLLPMALPFDFSRANLKVGSSFPDRSGPVEGGRKVIRASRMRPQSKPDTYDQHALRGRYGFMGDRRSSFQTSLAILLPATNHSARSWTNTVAACRGAQGVSGSSYQLTP